MEVSQIAELDSHAIIGGESAQAFGLEDNAELYALLSDKIYRDKKRAAMREVICNAWDAHIIAGKTDVPLEITVTDTDVAIRDFGPGIPHDKMHRTYCVYGGTTKVEDPTQNGGFGLGSKAPFAVSDHFTVLNQNSGLKTIYALSRGGAATQGRPDMRAMIKDRPTTESGVMVTIPIKSADDRREFENNIRIVVRQGGILANMNGVPLERFDYTAARPNEFCVVANWSFYEGGVYVLYGTVLYPLTTTNDEITKLAQNALSLAGKKAALVLIAPPNSIAVTPSRESLSYVEKTEATVKRLLKKAHRQIDAAIPAARRRALQEFVETEGRYATEQNFKTRDHFPDTLSSAAAIADHYIASHGPRAGCLDVRKPIAKFLAKKFPNERRFYRRSIQRFEAATNLSFQMTSKPLIRIASRMGLLKDTFAFNLYAYKREHSGSKTNPLSTIERYGNFAPTFYVARNLRDLRPMFSAAAQSARRAEDGDRFGGFVLRQWTEKNLTKLRALCKHYGVALEAFDYEAAKAARKPREVKTDDAMYMRLEDWNGNYHSFQHSTPSCKEPAFYLMTWQRDEVYRSPFENMLPLTVAARYPNTVLITTKAQEEKLNKAGVRNLAIVMAERLIELTKQREVVYGETIRHGRMHVGSLYRSDIAGAAVCLSKSDVRIAKLLFPDRVTPGEAHKEAAFLYDALSTISSLSDDAGEKASKATEGLRMACFKTYPPRSTAEFRRDFPYLEILAGSSAIEDNGRKLNENVAQQMIETIKFLQRRASKSKLTNRAAANADTKKEAA